MARRMKWGDLTDLKEKIASYFEIDKVPTIPGLCIYLDISTECFNYYLNERYKYKHKSEEEKEQILKEIEVENDLRVEIEALEDFYTISPNMEVIDNYDACSKYDKDAEDTIKRQLSVEFKRAKLRLEDLTVKQVLVGKNSIGAMYLTKAVFGYRETSPEGANTNIMPSKITIQIMPAPNQPQLDGSKIGIKIDNQ